MEKRIQEMVSMLSGKKPGFKKKKPENSTKTDQEGQDEQELMDQYSDEEDPSDTPLESMPKTKDKKPPLLKSLDSPLVKDPEDDEEGSPEEESLESPEEEHSEDMDQEEEPKKMGKLFGGKGTHGVSITIKLHGKRK